MSLNQKSKEQLLQVAKKHIICVQSTLNEAIAFSESMGGYHKKRKSTAQDGEKLMHDSM